MGSFIYDSQRIFIFLTLIHFVFEMLLIPMLVQFNLVIPVMGQKEEIIPKSQPYIAKSVNLLNEINQSGYGNNSNQSLDYYPNTVFFQENKTLSYINSSIPHEKKNHTYFIIEDPVKRFYVINASDISSQPLHQYILASPTSNQVDKNAVNFVTPNFFSTPSQFVTPVESTVVVDESSISSLNQVPITMSTFKNAATSSSNANDAFIVTENSTITNQAIVYKNATLNKNDSVYLIPRTNPAEIQPQWNLSIGQYTNSPPESSLPLVSQNLGGETSQVIIPNFPEPTPSSASHIVSSHEKNITNIIFTNDQTNLNETNDSYYILLRPVSVGSINKSSQSSTFLNSAQNNQENKEAWQPIYADTPYIMKRQATDSSQNDGIKFRENISNTPYISRETNRSGEESNQLNMSVENDIVHTGSEAPPLKKEKEKTKFSFYNISSPGLYKIQGTSLVAIAPDSIEALSIKTRDDSKTFSHAQNESLPKQINESYQSTVSNVPYSNVIYANSQSNFFPMDNMSEHSHYLQANDTTLSNIILNNMKNDMVQSLQKVPYNNPQTVTHSVVIGPNEVSSWSFVNDSMQQSNSNA